MWLIGILYLNLYHAHTFLWCLAEPDTVHLSMARRQLECFADKNSKEAARAIGSTDADLGLILNHLLKQEIHTQAEAWVGDLRCSSVSLCNSSNVHTCTYPSLIGTESPTDLGLVPGFFLCSYGSEALCIGFKDNLACLTTTISIL